MAYILTFARSPASIHHDLRNKKRRPPPLLSGPLHDQPHGALHRCCVGWQGSRPRSIPSDSPPCLSATSSDGRHHSSLTADATSRAADRFQRWYAHRHGWGRAGGDRHRCPKLSPLHPRHHVPGSLQRLFWLLPLRRRRCRQRSISRSGYLPRRCWWSRRCPPWPKLSKLVQRLVQPLHVCWFAACHHRPPVPQPVAVDPGKYPTPAG